MALEDLPDVHCESPYDVIVRTVFTGVCGSDFDLCASTGDGIRFRGPHRFPVVLGHESSGIVVAVGERVTRVGVGMPVAVESVLPCGACDLCLAGYRNECPHVELLGLTTDGSFAERFVVPESACHALTPLVEQGFELRCALVAGALLEVFGCVFKSLVIEANQSLLGARVVIHGLGPIGAAAGMLARAAGAASVVGIEPHSHRRAFAEKLGFDACFDLSTAVAAIRNTWNGTGADVQVDATDNSSGLPLAGVSAAPRGTIVVMSRARESATIDCSGLISGGIQLRGSRGQSGHLIYARLLRLVASHRLCPSKLVSTEIDFDEVPSLLRQRRYDAPGKVIVRVNTDADPKEAL